MTAPSNAFIRNARKVYNPIGFQKGYAFILWCIGAGTLVGFTAARIYYLNFDANFCPVGAAGANGAAPGECYWMLNFSRYKVALILHLATIFPAAILAALQFTPVIRRKFITYHRIAGYVAVFLAIVSTGAAFALAEKSFGGSLSVRGGMGLLGIMFVGALVLAIVNIRRKQIEQHRAWMLRAWAYAASIVTLRIIMIISASIITKLGPENAIWEVYDCNVLRSLLHNDARLVAQYPTCAPVVGASTVNSLVYYVAIQANMKLGVENLSAALHAGFAMGTWLALAIHAILVELYLKLTPREAERLRQLSYQRQLEAGYRHPGSAGLVVEKLGDAEPWVPECEKQRRVAEKLSPVSSFEASSQSSMTRVPVPAYMPEAPPPEQSAH